MFDRWYLERATTECPNDDCGHLGNLYDFVDLDSDDYPIDEDFTLYGECPMCGKAVRLTISPHIDFYVSEELQ